jgi:hypothetical protein
VDGSGGAGPREAAGSGDRAAAAVDELYGADPQSFTERRTELAAAARDAGDKVAAKAIAALRRPTRAAWVVNLLARTDPSGPAKLAELGAALRAAQEAGHGPRLRELSAARGALVDALTGQALSLAGVADPPPALRLEVSQTLTAALADPGVAAEFAAGTLTRSVQWSGFGVLPPAAGDGDEAGAGAEEAADAAPDIPYARLGVVTSGRPKSGAAKTHPPGATGAAARPAADAPAGPGAARRGRAGAAQPSAEVVARRQAEEDERLAREAAERAARHREQYEEAERTVASTAAAAADALAAEDRLEREVRDLEERLTRARADLAGVRMRARQAETAERRARQALDRLGRD